MDASGVSVSSDSTGLAALEPTMEEVHSALCRRAADFRLLRLCGIGFEIIDEAVEKRWREKNL